MKRGKIPFFPSPAKMPDKVLPPMYPSPVLLPGCHEAACVLPGAVQKHNSGDRASTVTQHPLQVQQQQLNLSLQQTVSTYLDKSRKKGESHSYLHPLGIPSTVIFKDICNISRIIVHRNHFIRHFSHSNTTHPPTFLTDRQTSAFGPQTQKKFNCPLNVPLPPSPAAMQSLTKALGADWDKPRPQSPGFAKRPSLSPEVS